MLIGEDGTVEPITLPAASSARVTALQHHIGGVFDVVALSEDLDMWLHDEGVFVCHLNPVASRIAAAHGLDRQPGGCDAAGDTLGLDPDTLRVLTAMATSAAAEGDLTARDVDGHRYREITARRARYRS